MSARREITFIVPPRVARPISWRGKPGWFGQKFWIKWTDGSYRRCTRQTILDLGEQDG